MMWISLCLILTTASGFFCDDDDIEVSCFYRAMATCEEKAPSGFPENSAELLGVCRDVQEYATCLANARETCDDSEFISHHIQSVRSSVDYLKSTCKEDNPTFKAISRNLQCIKRVPEKHIYECRESISEDKLNVARRHLHPVLTKETSGNAFQCLFRLEEATCQGTVYEYYCGADVRDAVEEITSGMLGRQIVCTPELLEKLEPYREALEAIILEELELENALEKKRK